MVNATFGFFTNAFIFGAVSGVPNTICLPFQWKQIGMTLGVPSCQTYAKRAGIVDRSKSCAIGSLSNPMSPCFVAIVFLLTSRSNRRLLLDLFLLLRLLSAVETEFRFAGSTHHFDA